MVRHEWYVYVLPFEDIPVGTVLSGYATEAEAREEAERVQLEIPKWRGLVLALPRSDERILEYGRTHAAWASEEDFEELLVREGDVGTLAESIMAEDTKGFSHRIPEGMEVKINSITSKYVSFTTGEVIEGENVFVAGPLTFRKVFRKGVAPMGGTVRTQVEVSQFLSEVDVKGKKAGICGCWVDLDRGLCLSHGYSVSPMVKCPIARCNDEEWRKAYTEALKRVGILVTKVTPVFSEARAEAGIFRCRYCGAPYLYRENLKIHERGCPRRAGY